MELREPGTTISFFSRVIFQLPTITLSTISMIAISRNLGPSGRGEVSQFLLLSALTSSIICTPIFLSVMNLKDANEIKSYINRSIYLFSRKNLSAIFFMNICYFSFNGQKSLESNLKVILFLDLITCFYFICAQIRDLLLRFHKNKIYGLDFILQLLISLTILILLLTDKLTTTLIVQCITLFYGLYAVVLLAVFKQKVREFKLIKMIRMDQDGSRKLNTDLEKDSFSKSGILFQFLLSKDLLLGLFFLSKEDFGLMSALASFWVIIRFLRPSAVIQFKVGEGTTPKLNSGKRRYFKIANQTTSAIHLQMIAICVVGLSGWSMIPTLLGSGFQPTKSMALAGVLAEVILMKSLYDQSISSRRRSQNAFVVLSILQILAIVIYVNLGASLSITLIWMSSAVIYLLWQLIELLKRKYE